MSDFTSNFWALWVAGITIVSIVYCAIILVGAARMKVHTAADGTTGHHWDDGTLAEINNPLPGWWTWMFVITIVFAVGYAYMYPALGTHQGSFGWSSADQHKKEVEAGLAKEAPLYAKFAAMKVEEVAKNEEAMRIGERLFMNNCAQCHGSDAKGGVGYPNLTDKDWLYGGAPENIVETITNGRNGVMPPMAAAVGSADDVKNLANYVLSLSGSGHDSVKANLGKEKFAACAACHGPDGKGMQALGAPNLTDGIWLHGAGETAVTRMVNEGKNNVMPAQGSRFTKDQIHVLTAYVWGKSN
jgi:cytochrome c oxidase cbb3-type subunit 3